MQYKLIIFDLDGTLITGYLNRQDKDYMAVEPLLNRVDVLTELQRAGVQVAIATNQGGIAFGYNTEQQFREKILIALECLGLPLDTPVAVCFSDVRGKPPYNDPIHAARRKPSPIMLEELMQQYGATPLETLFVGDRPEDQDAAINAGCSFAWAVDFFC